MAEFFIGVDGGGTGCRAAIADVNGVFLGQGCGGPANIVTNLEGALVNIRTAIDAAFAQAGLEQVHYARSHAFLGLAGANIAGAGTAIAQAMPFAHTEVESDGLIALQGALGDQDGVVVILGTGTAYIIRNEGKIRFIGGWGFPLSDLGSGARLGQSLLQECLLVHDGIHPGSPLISALLNEFDNKPDNLVEFGRKAVPADYGRYAPRIFDYAQRGDLTALMLLKRSVAYVGETLDMLILQGVERISLLGGMARFYREYLPDHQQKLLVEPAADGLTGAVQLVLKRFLSSPCPKSQHGTVFDPMTERTAQ
ncbi:N-acetylglucosamine kinase [Falsochrobactrum sp. TDYN1]|uniref:N-acetylglucosamine kinase n=1 Tax=Falsochrobactrum tianjinense TaxID=2706015 RepID=A0A949PMP8_9HYPH|nr:N-acetylglucosamine kinase [Falsochrobactrum sp. TDYN1]MBV2143254.1 N-acetylglucosamine kinase [Falsochrobactrum sp. TDYN1]